MKILTIILLAGCIQLSAHSFSQGITLSLHNASITTAFKEIEKQSSYRFVYTDEQLKGTSPITISVENAPLQKVLELCFKDQPLTFSIEEQFIMVKRQEKVLPPAVPTDNELKGRVTSEKGDPLAGASVQLKGTQRGTTTDQQGNFTLPDVPPGSVVIVSSIGYEKQELTVGKNIFLSIHLSIAVSGLDEIHIIGYGTTTKRLSTGSISKVGAETIEKQPVTNPLQALEGRVAGLQIIQSNGLPGAPISVQIRGRNSIAADNNPLYIVDGVPFTSTPIEVLGGPNGNGAILGSPLNSISPSDIESIEVLKDADATSIYGSRGSNGVILITTKKGKSGKSTLDVNISGGEGKITSMPKGLNTQQYLQARRDGLFNSGLTANPSNAPDLVTWDTTKYTDWQKWYMGGIAQLRDANGSFSGGNGQTNFLLSGAYHNETTVLPTGGDYSRTSLHFYLGHNSLNQKFNLTCTAFYTSDKNKLGGVTNSELGSIARAIPDYPVYDNAGKFNWTGGQNNFPAELTSYSKRQTDNLNSAVTLQYALFTGLHLKANLGYNKIGINQDNVLPSFSHNPVFNLKGISVFGNQDIKSYLFEPQVVFDKQLSLGRLEILAGLTIQHTISNNSTFLLTGYPNDLLLESINYGTVAFNTASTTDYKFMSLFGRISYNWKTRYIINGTYRRDGSTRFGPGKQFGNFGSIGSAWLFSNEKFIKQKLKWLSFGKFILSYGNSGNDGIKDYGYLSTYTNTSNYGSMIAIVPTQIANPNFQWEENRKLQITGEFGFLKDRILLTLAWYRNHSSNQLVGYALPAMTGFSSYQANLPAIVENKGWEFELNTINIKDKNFGWTSSFNFTVPKNKLVDFPNLAASAYANKYVIGQPLSVIQGYHFLNVDPQTGLALVEDVNKDGKYTASSSYNNQGGDFIIIGKTGPDWFGGLNNSVTYNGFQLDIFFQFVKQQGYNIYRYNYNNLGSLSNGWTDYLGYWKAPGDLVNLPKPTHNFEPSSERFRTSDAGISNASFLRLKNISLYYTLPAQVLTRLKLTNMRLFLRGQNIWTLSTYKGFDPETADNANPMIPTLKTITFGLQCSF